MDPVVHFEIPVKDVERAKTFYAGIFGWKLNQMGDEYGQYIMVHTGPTDKDGMPERNAFINGGFRFHRWIPVSCHYLRNMHACRYFRCSHPAYQYRACDYGTAFCFNHLRGQ